MVVVVVVVVVVTVVMVINQMEYEEADQKCKCNGLKFYLFQSFWWQLQWLRGHRDNGDDRDRFGHI